MITVYGYPKTRATRVTWALEELSKPYNYQLVDLHSGEGKSRDYLTINPGGKIPAIRDGELLMTESGAIVNYLGDKYSEKALIPNLGTAARAKYHQWSYFVLAELEQPLWSIGKHKFALPADRRVPAMLETATWEFQQALGLLSQGLASKDYILGGQFQLVDILIGHTLHWAKAFQQELAQENIQAYLDRLESRSALQRTIEREAALS